MLYVLALPETKESAVRKSQTTTRPYLRLADILELIPVSKSTWWNWVAQKKVPPGRKLSPRVTVWSREDVLALVKGGENV